MITDGRQFDTNIFFSGGAGMFIQYHDIVKPAYLYAIVKMIFTQQSFGLPVSIIKDMSIFSIIEWYMKRRYKNPLMSLDFMHKIDKKDLDDLLRNMLLSDESIYKLSPALNIQKLFYVYKRQHMSFPVYIYSEEEEPYIVEDCKTVFSGVPHRYLHGSLKDAIEKCDQNFTYIFSDIELVKEACEVLTGTCSHVLMARDYRYNYIGNYEAEKYNLEKLASEHPFIRIGTTLAADVNELSLSFARINV